MNLTAITDPAGNALGDAADSLQALAPDRPLTVRISTDATSPFGLSTVRFALDFNRDIRASTLETPDINATAGTVSDPVSEPRHRHNLGAAAPGPGRLHNPQGVAVDGASGRVYAADLDGGSLHIFDLEGRYTGNVTGLLGSPHGVAADPHRGLTYVADTGNGRVAVLNGTGHLVASIANSFGDIRGVAADPHTGNVYVVDRGLANVQIFNSARDPIHTITGPFSVPHGVAVDPATGNLYVTDTGTDTVLVFDSAWNRIRDLAGTFDDPAGVAVDPTTGTVYVADTGNDRIAVLDPAGPPANLTGSFSSPHGVAVDPATGNLYVADTGYNRIQTFGMRHSFEVAGLLNGQSLAVNVPAARVQDPAGHPNAASNTVRIDLEIAAPKPVITVAQSSPTNATTVNYAVDWGEIIDPATLDTTDIEATSGTVRNLRQVFSHVEDFGGPGSGNGSLRNPQGVAVDPATGDIYVADFGNGRVQIFDPSLRNTGNITGGLRTPAGVAVDGATGTVYVTDLSGNRVAAFDAAGNPLPGITGGLDGPYGVAVDGSTGDVYVANTGNNRVLVFDSDLNHTGTITGTATDPFDYPAGVAVDGTTGTVYVADPFRNRVTAFERDGTRIGDLAGDFNNPYGVATDGAGNVYVANTVDDRIAVFDSARDRIATLSAPLDDPYGVAVDDNTGTLYAASSNSHYAHAFNITHAFDVADPAGGRPLMVSIPAGRVHDLDGNANEGSNVVRIDIDRTPPVPVITAAQSSPTRDAAINLRVVWNEDVDGFAAPDIALSGTAPHGGVANFTGGGTEYSFDVLLGSGGTMTVDIPAGAAHNEADTPGAAVRFSMIYLDAPPVPTVSTEQSDPTRLRNVPFVLGFDAGINASTLDAQDINATSGTVRNLRQAPQHDGDIATGSPAGLAVDAFSGTLYVASPNGNGVSVFDSAGRPAAPLSPADPFTLPQGVAVHGASGTVYVADTGGHRIAVFDHAGRHTADIAGMLLFPGGVDVDPASGTIYVADTYHNRIAIFNSTLHHTANITKHVSSPSDVAVDGISGNIYVANYGRGTVAVFDPQLRYLFNLTGTFDGPSGVAADPYSGHVYVADRNAGRVAAFDSAGASTANLTGMLGLPSGVAVDPVSGTLYAADTYGNRVRTFGMSYAFEVADPADGQRFSVSLPADSVRDATDHPNAASNTVTIGADRTAPRLLSAEVTSPGSVTVRYTEPVYADGTAAAYGALVVDGVTRTYPAAPLSGNGTAAHTLAFTGDPAASDATGRILLNMSAVTDPAGNPLGGGGGDPAVASTILQVISDGQPPRITAAAITDPGRFTVRYSEPVYAAGTAYGTLVVGGGTPRTYAAAPLWGNGTAVHALGFLGAPAGGGDTGTLAVNQTAVSDPSGNALGSLTADLRQLAPGGLLTAGIRANTTSPTNMSAVSFTVDFGRRIDASTIGIPDIRATEGTVRNLGPDLAHGRDIGSSGRGPGMFHNPAGVAFDNATGRLYVADRNNHRVQIFNSAGHHTGYIADSFNFPYDVATDPARGLVYVADTGNDRVAVFNASRHLVASITRSFVDVHDVGVDPVSGNVYVSDLSADLVHVFGPGWGHIHTITGGPPGGRFNNPQGVAVDAPSNRIYVADTRNDRIRMFDLAWGYTGDLPGTFDDPTDVAVDGFSGRIYVTDTGNYRVQVFGPQLDRVAVLADPPSFPVSVAVDGTTGTAYVADAAGHRIRVFDPEYSFEVAGLSGGQSLAVSMPAGRVTDAEDNANTASNTVKLDIEMIAPVPALTAAAYPVPTNTTLVNLWVAFGESVDTATFDTRDVNATSGTVVNLRQMLLHGADFGGTGTGRGMFDTPAGVDVDGSGNIYVADALNNAVQVFGPDLRYTANITGGFTIPTDVAVDGTSGNIYVADALNNRVAVFGPDLRPLPYLDHRFDMPTGVAVSTAGDIYVVGTGDGRISVFGPGGSHLYDIADVVAPPGQLRGIAVNGTGSIYVTDSGNARIMILNSTGHHHGTITGPLVQPYDIAINHLSGDIYVADTGNNRTVVFNATDTTPPT